MRPRSKAQSRQDMLISYVPSGISSSNSKLLRTERGVLIDLPRVERMARLEDGSGGRLAGTRKVRRAEQKAAHSCTTKTRNGSETILDTRLW